MSWSLAPALVQFRSELDKRYPKRDKTSDGTLGNAEHSSRASDHNPNDYRIVCAMDVDEDLLGSANTKYPRFNPGANAKSLFEYLLARCKSGKETRIAYMIYEGYIYSRTYNWAKRKYSGANPHDHHLHISIRQLASAWNNTARWWPVVPVPVPAPVKYVLSKFKGAVKVVGYNKSYPSHVAVAQQALVDLGYDPNGVDGLKGPGTLKAMVAFLNKFGWKGLDGKTLTFRQLDRLIWEAEKLVDGTQYPPRKES